MKFYSTNDTSVRIDLREAVTQGLAPDNGLYMPEEIPALPKHFFDHVNEGFCDEKNEAVSRKSSPAGTPMLFEESFGCQRYLHVQGW